MPNPTELAQSSAGAVLEQTEAYFRDATEALVVGGKVLDHAVSLHQLGAELEGTGENPDNSAIFPAAIQLAEVARQSLEMLHGLKKAGYIQMAEGDDPFELIAPTALALGAGEADADEGENNGNTADNTNGSADLTNKVDLTDLSSNSGSSPELSEVDPLTRQRQEALLVKIFGVKHEDEIADISQAGMVIFGKLMGRTYAGLKELHPRAVAGQAERAEQFEKYLAGKNINEMAAEYGVGPKSFVMMFKKSIEIINREVSPQQMDMLFTTALAAGKPQTIEA